MPNLAHQRAFNDRSQPNPLFLSVAEDSAIFAFKNFLPAAPFCADCYEKGCYRVPKKYAIEQAYDYIQFNSSNSIKWLVIDIDDHPDIWELIHSNKIPRPNIACLNQLKTSKDKLGSGHIAYQLNTAVHGNPNSSSEALRYFNYIRKCLTLLAGGDFGFAHLLTKNPLSDRWYTKVLRNEGYDLADLAEYCSQELYDEALKAQQGTEKSINAAAAKNSFAKDASEIDTHRNCYIFDTVRFWAYRAVHLANDYESWLPAVYERVAIVNAKLPEPKPQSDVRSISKSIASWTFKNIGRIHSSAFIETQRWRGKKGGQAKALAYDPKRSEALLLRQNGMTVKQISIQLGVSEKSIQRWTR